MGSSLPSTNNGHLCVLVHGLWGNPLHLDHLRRTLESEQPDSRLHILVAKSNSDSFTYDGIEVGGERIANEIEQKIQELEEQGVTTAKISIIGYSLGGLVARYAIGLLYKNGLMDRVQPVNFTTFATPHLGVRTPKLGYRAYAWNMLGSRTLSTSGQQMFLIDNFRGSGRPLLSILADPSNVFVKGLRCFKNRSIYANTINDRSVPFYTAYISRTDPYVDLQKVDLHYLTGQEDRVVLDPADPVALRSTYDKPTLYESWRPTQQTLSMIPFYLTLFSIFPIALPFFLLNSAYQTVRSSQRVRLHEAGRAGISLNRYRIQLLEEAQAVQDRVYERLAESQTEDYLPTPPPESLPSSSTDMTSREVTDKLGQHVTSTTDDSSFPILALLQDQFDMIDHLNAVGFEKFAVHIQQHRHTHAAIIVRMPKEAFSEGRVVVKHWAGRFEV